MKRQHIGFTGTQFGMTESQLQTVSEILDDAPCTDAVHIGDCIGTDEQFRNMAYLCGLWKIGHPPIKDDKRAFGTYDELREPKDYLERNKDIVDESTWIIACPKGNEEELRSGTWATIRYARKQGKAVMIVWPDGSTV